MTAPTLDRVATTVSQTVCDHPDVQRGQHAHACAELGIPLNCTLMEDDPNYERYWELVNAWQIELLLRLAGMRLDPEGPAEALLVPRRR